MRLAVLAGVLVICLICAPVAAMAGPRTNHGIELASFKLEVPPQPKLGDMAKISFTLKNVGEHTVVFSQRFGICVGARHLDQSGRADNRDFAHFFKGAVLKPGESLTHRAQQVLDTPGTWWFWAAFHAMDAWGTFHEYKSIVHVKPAYKVPPQDPSYEKGGGQSIVMWQGKKLPLQVFPPDNPWNQDISKFSVHPNSDKLVRNIGAFTNLHPDFGSGVNWKVLGQPVKPGPSWGVPYVVVRSDQKDVPIRIKYKTESDPGPYPIPPDAPVEGGPNGRGDRHVIAVDYDAKKLYELYLAFPENDGGWKADAAAIFDLASNKMRPMGWTSADAAGLPIFPGLVRYEEVVIQGEIRHALRFTAEKTDRAYIPPATHWASSVRTDDRPCMGMRFRLKAEFDISPFPEPVKVILRALKKYGMFLADNGGNWFITGAPHPMWDNAAMEFLKRIKGKEFEVVFTGERITK